MPLAGAVEPIPVSTRSSLALMREAAVKIREKNGNLSLFGSLRDKAGATVSENGVRFAKMAPPAAKDAYNSHGHFRDARHQVIAEQLYSFAKPLVQKTFFEPRPPLRRATSSTRGFLT